jgi:twitching motility protein PilT
MSLEKLGLPPVLKTFCTQPKGLVLVTGPTGSGKSTTLAAMIDYINRMQRCHIVTIEDPIEFVHEEDQCLINQREIGSHVKSFERGLRAALREDPDVVLLGELREKEAATLALEIANTGHLVFSTVHTNSAISTVERIIDMFPPDAQPQARSSLADNMRGVISQTLCKGRTGGRVAAVEVLVGSVAVANLIREDKPSQLQNIMQVGGKEGNRLLNDDLARLVRDRKVLYEEAQTKTIDRKDLARRLGKLPAPDPTRKKR